MTMKTYQHYHEVIAQTLAISSRKAEVVGMVNDRDPLDHIERLVFYPDLLAQLLVEQSIPYTVFLDRPALVIPAFRAVDDKLAFAALAAPYLTKLPEGVAETYIQDARAVGIVDCILASATERIRSPWRLDALGFRRRAASQRRKTRNELVGALSEYIESGAYRTEAELPNAELLEDEDLYYYFQARLATGGRPLPIDPAIAYNASGKLAFNLLAEHGPVRTTNFPMGPYMGLVQVLRDDPIWATEYLLAKDLSGPSDLAFWVPDQRYESVKSEQAREELASLFTKEVPALI